MDELLPAIRAELAKMGTAKEATPWRALFDALGTRAVEDKARRVHLLDIPDEPVVVPGAPGTTAVERACVRVLPHTTVKTTLRFTKADLTAFGKSKQVPDKVRDWLDKSRKAGNAVLFWQLGSHFFEVGAASCALVDLPVQVEAVRTPLEARALRLLVSENVYDDIRADDDLTKSVNVALRGTVVPVAGLDDGRAYVIRRGAGDAVVEVVHDLAAHWDHGEAGSVELMALEEFVVVAERGVRTYRLSLEPAGT